MTKRVYLDSNHWIKLVQIAKGKETDLDYKKIYEEIRHRSDSNATIFPISMATVYDFTRQYCPEKRAEIIDLIVDISKGWFLQPVTLFFEKEIENAIMHRLNRESVHNISHEILQKGISYYVGSNFEQFIRNKNMSSKLMCKLKINFKKINEDLDVIKNHLKDPKLIKLNLDILHYHQEKIIEMERNRKNRRELDKTLRKRFCEASSIIDLVGPHLTKFITYNKIPLKKICSPSQNMESMQKFVEDMPSLNVFSKLINARDEISPERPIKTNDLWDVIHFSGAIPYCDILVAEKMFAALSKRNKLDIKYNCVILTDLKNLQRIEF